jgi:hypothetical protein
MTKFCSRALGAVLLLISVSFGWACAPTVPGDPPQIKADQVIVFVDAFHAGVVSVCGSADPLVACVPGGLDTPIAHELIRTAEDLHVILVASKVGWQAAARAGWAAEKPRFDGVTDQKIRLLIAAVSAILDVL